MWSQLYVLLQLVAIVHALSWTSSFKRPSIALKPAEIAGQELIQPGDYVTHEQYGVGVYKGVLGIPMKRNDPRAVDFLLIQFQDSELVLSWLQAQNQLYMNRQPEKAESGATQRKNSYAISDTKKWDKRKKESMESTKKELLYLMDLYRARAEKYRTPSIDYNEEYEKFEREFPYQPTLDQLQCFKDIAKDMVNMTIPMNRLVCGDVGFGKTEVGFRALYRAVLSGKQVAFLAPTRLLAIQHYKSMQDRFPNLKIACLHAGVKYEQAKIIKQNVTSGYIQVLVGTQSVLGEKLLYHNLGLLIVDEEQRFGVENKVRLVQKYIDIDVLTLTATPIPRTLKQAMDGLVDISSLDTPPMQRKAVQIQIVEAAKRGVERGISLTSERKKGKLYVDFDVMAEGITKELARGGQCFVICPHISNLVVYETEIKNRLPSIRIISIHGRMEDIEEKVVQFAEGEADILLATTVIENGINIPSVNTIFISEAERFGLATLYQLKGRVGRGDQQAYAYFLYGQRENVQSDAELRLNTIQSLQGLGSGRKIAYADLGLRGAGSMYGNNQSGTINWIGPGLSNRYAELQSMVLASRTILPARDTLTLLHDALEALALEKDESLVIPKNHNQVREMALFELAIIRTILYLLQEKANLSQNNRVDLEKGFSRLLSGEDGNFMTEMLNKIFPTKIPTLVNRLLERIQLRRQSRKGGISYILRTKKSNIIMSNGNVDANSNSNTKAATVVNAETIASKNCWHIGMEKMSSTKWKMVLEHVRSKADIELLKSLIVVFDDNEQSMKLYTHEDSIATLQRIIAAIEKAGAAMFQEVSSEVNKKKKIEEQIINASLV